MEASTKETVIVVHGTWAAPEAGAMQWYEPVYGARSVGGFASKLNDALEKRGSAARCWAHCSEGSQIFHWSGANDWVARTSAASALREYVTGLRKQGWRCHIVAHSHGGSVVAQALSNPPTGLDSPPGKVVTLGTPFIDTMSPILKSMERKRKTVDVASWIGIAILFLFFTCVMYFAFLTLPPALFVKAVLTDYVALLLIPAYILTVAGLIWLILRRLRQTAEGKFPSTENTLETLPDFLAMGSLLDEPWQILHHMRNADNPLAIRSNPLRYVLSVLEASVSNSSDVARIQGAKTYRDLAKGGKLVLLVAYVLTVLVLAGALIALASYYLLKDVVAGLGTTGLGAAMLVVDVVIFFFPFFVILFGVVVFFANRWGRDFYSAYLSPFRWCAHRVGCLGSIFTALATYLLRRRAWKLLQTMAMGLEGYRYQLPSVEQRPSYAVGAVKYENMPAAAEQRALKARSNWVGLHLGDLSQAFARIAITAADITSLLRTVEADQSLVHGAYYSDDDCIARIADWIAGRG
jgi:hypothetical protein